MTREEALELLEAVNTKLDAQGNPVDDRLLDKKNNLEKLIAEFDKEEHNGNHK